MAPAGCLHAVGGGSKGERGDLRLTNACWISCKKAAPSWFTGQKKGTHVEGRQQALCHLDRPLNVAKHDGPARLLAAPIGKSRGRGGGCGEVAEGGGLQSHSKPLSANSSQTTPHRTPASAQTPAAPRIPITHTPGCANALRVRASRSPPPPPCPSPPLPPPPPPSSPSCPSPSHPPRPHGCSRPPPSGT